MSKASGKSLRCYFGILAGLYFLMTAGAFSQVALLRLKSPGAKLAPLFLIHAGFIVVIGLAFAVIAVKFYPLMARRPKVITGVLHANFGGSILFAAIDLSSGTRLNFVGLVLSAFIYVYLWKSVERLAKEPAGVQSLVQPPSAD